MEITPALGAATMLQTRVGQSMALVQNQLAPPERAGVLLQTGSQSITTAVLTGMKEVQQQSLEKLNAICGFLETQVEIEREKENTFPITIFNSDGGEVSACGNGSRCVAYLLSKNLNANQIKLKTSNRSLNAKIVGNLMVELEMGKPLFNFEDIPLSKTVNPCFPKG